MTRCPQKMFFSDLRSASLRVFILLVTCVFATETAVAFEFSEKFAKLPKEKKVLAVNAAGLTFITGWGLANWNYGDRSPHARSEDWFDRDTANGGVDKLGHLYDNYVVTHGLAWLYESWGYTSKRAGFYGALSALGIMGFMEAGDSFSDYGFSHEDFLMNALGSGLGYLFYVNPALAAKFDFRVEYVPDFDRLDIFTDYENQKYLAVVKLDGFEAVRNEPLKYLELHLGYYTKGYSDTSRSKERNIYWGVGINLARIFARHSHKKFAGFLNYYQPPLADIKMGHDFNR